MLAKLFTWITHSNFKLKLLSLWLDWGDFHPFFSIWCNYRSKAFSFVWVGVTIQPFSIVWKISTILLIRDNYLAFIKLNIHLVGEMAFSDAAVAHDDFYYKTVTFSILIFNIGWMLICFLFILYPTIRFHDPAFRFMSIKMRSEKERRKCAGKLS
jgi:hypothetical protein